MAAEKEEGLEARSYDYSLASHREVLFPCLDAAAPATVVEVGAFKGEFTEVLLGWADEVGRSRRGDRPRASPGTAGGGRAPP